MKNIFKLIILLTVTISLLLAYFSKFTQANSATEFQKLHKIYYKNEKNDTEILDFINDIETSIILSINYEKEIPLNENYEMITNFLTTYIQIKEPSIKYIDISEIYKLSDVIFGIDYYYITNKNITNKMQIEVSPLPLKEVELIAETEQVIHKKNNIQVLKKYKYLDIKYKYIFNIKDNNQIVLENVVLE